ncbi:MAG TPA: glycosyltransferase [Planctomycetes bacterium]|nr:glycosyltransferase [Planctomycetota bacterium]
MKTSIITVCLNSAETIEDCIKSVMTQTWPDIEHIIIDGGSTDKTIDIINNFKGHIAKYISEPDQGIYDAMNKGIELSSGDVIGILNSDDVYADETTVGRMVELIQSNCLDAVYADLAYIDPRNSDCIKRFWKAGTYKKKAFFFGWAPPHPTFFCRRKVYEKFGFYRSDMKIAADFELMLRLIEKHQIRIGYLPKVIVKMRMGGKANVLGGIIRGNLEIIRSFRLNGFSVSPWFFILKPITKISQYFLRPESTKSTGLICKDTRT